MAEGIELTGPRGKEAADPDRIGMDGDFNTVRVGTPESRDDPCIGDAMGRNRFSEEIRMPPSVLTKYQPGLIPQSRPDRGKASPDFFVGRGLGAHQHEVEGTLFTAWK